MSDLRVWKYQATGNDFVMTFDPEDGRPLDPEEVVALCDRRFGVGADGTIRVTAGSEGRPFMDYTNADGSLAEMCGNGLRCVALLLRDLGEAAETGFEVETRAGLRRVTFEEDGRVTVDMGVPNFTKAVIPMRGPAWETFLDEPLDLGGGLVVRASAVSMGNPHLVLFVEDDPERFHVAHIGEVLERDDRFPEGTNVEFARVGSSAIDARVWERGSGETMACGSGACAIAVAAHEAGLAGRRTTVAFPGGDVDVERREDGSVTLTGPATRVFETTVDLDELTEALGS
ncbi:MAG TPA: diaminopimelate epimerase [Actinomycetota bacterium]|nr:diaminopimelate epimerase [Actinomycetota bacterium]